MQATRPERPSRQPGIDAEDLAALYRTHLGIFQHLAYTYLGFADEADEAVQESFLRAWRFRDRFRGECSLSTWLGTIVRRECLHALRRHRARLSAREVPLEHADDNRTVNEWREPAVEASAFEHANRAGQRAFILRFAHRLRAADRAFVLAMLAGQEPDTTRRAADKSARHRAVTQLRGILRDRTTAIVRRNKLFATQAA